MNLPRAPDTWKQPAWTVLGKRRARAKKKEFIVKRLGGKCIKCGSTSSLQLHHPRHDRHYGNGIVSRSWAFIKREIRGKQLMCISCNSAEVSEYKSRYSEGNAG